jgi:hypothetical protein
MFQCSIGEGTYYQGYSTKYIRMPLFVLLLFVLLPPPGLCVFGASPAPCGASPAPLQVDCGPPLLPRPAVPDLLFPLVWDSRSARPALHSGCPRSSPPPSGRP